ncbi:3'-5' exonuclease [Chytridiales sp. JEL 0842]|nr:3'-5' exonuclease [Chytridiales sp. JEL 0842]
MSPSKTAAVKSLPWYTGLQDPLAVWFSRFDTSADFATHHNLSDLSHPFTPPNPENTIAIDCEMVVVRDSSLSNSSSSSSSNSRPDSGKQGTRPCLARVSVVDYNGAVLLDTYCKPKEEIVDFKTKYSGVTEKHLADAPSVKKVQKKVAKLLADKIIVGQSVTNDLKVLNIDWRPHQIRDTAYFFKRFHPFGKTPGLRDLAKWNLALEIQKGSHDSIIDARVAMLLYRQIRRVWETTHPLPSPPLPAEELALAQQPFKPVPIPSTLPSEFHTAMQALTPTHLPTSLPTLNPDQADLVPIISGTSPSVNSTTIARGFYPFLPKKQSLMRFQEGPQWVLPKGSAEKDVAPKVGVNELLKGIKEKKRKKNEKRKEKKKEGGKEAEKEEGEASDSESNDEHKEENVDANDSSSYSDEEKSKPSRSDKTPVTDSTNPTMKVESETSSSSSDSSSYESDALPPPAKKSKKASKGTKPPKSSDEKVKKKKEKAVEGIAAATSTTKEKKMKMKKSKKERDVESVKHDKKVKSKKRKSASSDESSSSDSGKVVKKKKAKKSKKDN